MNAGRKLVELLDTGLANGAVWSASERAVLTLIADTADRVETLKALLAAEVKGGGSETDKCVKLAGEIRLAQANIAKMIGTLDPEMTAGTVKSERHVRAANARWSGAGLSHGH